MVSPLRTFASLRQHRRPVGLVVLAGLALAPTASAQIVRVTTASAVIGSLGQVLGTSGLVVGAREKSGNLNVLGTVTVRHNGPYRLEVRLTAPFTDKNKANVVNTVTVRTPAGTFLPLSTGTWVTAALGPGTASQTQPVHYLILWAKSSSKDPKHALTIPVTYRVVPQ